MLLSLRKWLSGAVIEDAGVDRPFRLRRASLLLLVAGWATFLVSCLIGLWLIRHNLPVAGWSDVLHGRAEFGALQAIKAACEVVGGATFFAGLFSVSLFDRADRVPLWRID